MRAELDDERVRRYLLGLLSEAEAEALEESYFADADIQARVRGVEDDLLDDYAAGRLSEADRRIVERVYTATPARRARLVAARALARRMGSPAGSRPGWASLAAIAAGLALVVIVLQAWPPSPSPVDSVSVSPTASPSSAGSPAVPSLAPSAAVSVPSPPAAPIRTLALALAPGRLRGETATRELRIAKGIDEVAFELEGDASTLPPAPASLRALIETVEGEEIWRGDAHRARPGDRPSLLALARVPAPRLRPGDYFLTLDDVRSGQTLYRYFFRVVE